VTATNIEVGVDLARMAGEIQGPHAIGSHHGDVEPETVEAVIVPDRGRHLRGASRRAQGNTGQLPEAAWRTRINRRKISPGQGIRDSGRRELRFW